MPRYFLQIIYHKTSKHTDLCDKCESGKLLVNQITTTSNNIQALQQASCIGGSCVSVENSQQLQQAKCQLSQLQASKQAFDVHIQIKNKQRETLNNLHSTLQQDEAVLFMDFKEKIQLGQGPNELGRDFYRRQPMAVFGIMITRASRNYYF